MWVMFAIFTDTSANLPTTLLEKCEIGCVPFAYYIDDLSHTCLDTDAFDAAEYYGEIRKGMTVTTSQVNPQTYIEAFTPELEKGNDVLFIGMSSGISGSYASSQMAAAELSEKFPERKIVTVDTLAASLGEGIIVLHAVDCRRKGMVIEETQAYLLKRVRRMCQLFTVDDLNHLRRTGRCSGVAAVLGTALQIKPILFGDTEGKIVIAKKKRGRKQAIKWIAEHYEKFVKDPEKQVVGLAHADCEADANYLKSLLIRTKPPKHILMVDYEPVTGSHVGPGALALFFECEEGIRETLLTDSKAEEA